MVLVDVEKQVQCFWMQGSRNSAVENLLCGAPSRSEACLFFSNDLLQLWLQSVQCNLQLDFAWVAK